MSTFLCKNGVRKEYFLTPTFIIEPFCMRGQPVLRSEEKESYFSVRPIEQAFRWESATSCASGINLAEKAARHQRSNPFPFILNLCYTFLIIL